MATAITVDVLVNYGFGKVGGKIVGVYTLNPATYMLLSGVLGAAGDKGSSELKKILAVPDSEKNKNIEKEQEENKQRKEGHNE